MTRDDPGMRLARAQRLTGRATELGRAEARSAVRGRGVPGGSHVRPTRTTETGPRDDRPHTGATSLQTCLVFSAPRPRPSKSPGIHRKNSGPPPSDPGVRASAGLGGGGGSLERTRLAAILAPHVVGEQQSHAGWIPASPAISRFNASRSSSSRGAAEDPVSPSLTSLAAASVQQVLVIRRNSIAAIPAIRRGFLKVRSTWRPEWPDQRADLDRPR